MYYIRLRDLKTRTALIGWLHEKGIHSVFHYVPLHSSPAGRRFGRFCGEDRFTTKESERLLRLPLFYDLTTEEVEKIIDEICAFFEVSR